MPAVTIIKFEGSEDEISRFLAQNGYGTAVPQPSNSKSGAHVNGMWDQVARTFERHISETAAAGRPGQKKAVQEWLKADGRIKLKSLWNAAGVKTQHDYAGVGGSLTKNMVKAKGPKGWYTWHLDKSGEWIYEIIPELVEPLKQAFGV